MRSRASALVVAVALVAAACEGASYVPPQPPTQDAAVAYLETVVAVVQSRDLTGLCRLGGGTCAHTLAESDPATVPNSSPTVIGSRVIPPSRADGGWSLGGRLLELCGRDGLGHPYSSEMLVFWFDGRLISIEPVYWIGLRIAGGQGASRWSCSGSP